MLGAVPNPKKTITIPFSTDKVLNAIQALPKINTKYHLTKKNLVFKTCTLEALEFLSLGVYVDFSLTEVSELKTEITMEVRRKVGAFDQAYEVQRANEHIDILFDSLSEVLALSDDKIKELLTQSNKESIERNKPWYENTFILVLVTIIFWPVGLYGIIKRFSK